MPTALSTVPLGEMTLDLQQGRLIGPAGEVPLRAKSFALLCHMARERGRVMSKDELLAAVWPDVTVTDESLTQCIHDVRRALGPASTLLRTIPRRGYVLDAADAGMQTLDRIPGSIAVMPFILTGPDAVPDQVLFDGLAHDVLSQLASMRAFHIIGRGTSFSLGHMITDPVGLGKLVRAAYLVAGHATRHGAQFRLHVDLLDCTSGHMIWTNGYDLHPDRMMHASRHVTHQLVTAIAHEVTTQERRFALRDAPDQPPDAWRSFHLGLNEVMHPDGALTFALNHFDTAIRLDPGFARAHALKSFCHYNFAMANVGPDRQAIVQAAYAAASDALSLDDASPAAHWAYGRALWLKQDPSAAMQRIQHALDLCPSFPQAHYMAGFIEAHQGDPTRAMTHLNAFESLSPLDPLLTPVQLSQAIALARLGDSEGAANYALRASSHQYELDHLQCHAALLLAGLGCIDDAREIMSRPPICDAAFHPPDLMKIIYGMPDDVVRLLQDGGKALNLLPP